MTTNKASGGGGIPGKLFQILRDDAVKVLYTFSMQANLEHSAVATGLEKVTFHSNPKEMPKNAQTTTQLHSSHVLAK